MRVRMGKYSYRVRRYRHGAKGYSSTHTTRTSGFGIGGFIVFIMSLILLVVFLGCLNGDDWSNFWHVLKWESLIWLIIHLLSRGRTRRRKLAQAELVRQQAEAEAERQRKEQEWLKAMLSAGISEIDGMTGVEFEERMAIHFRTCGFQVQMTRASGDFGADLILTDSQAGRTVVQLKRYSRSVGVSAVQEVVAARQYYRANASMVITNSHLTRNAKQLARVSDVLVWEREELIRQLAQISESRTA